MVEVAGGHIEFLAVSHESMLLLLLLDLVICPVDLL